MSNISAKVRISINVGDKIHVLKRNTRKCKDIFADNKEREYEILKIDSNKIICKHEKGFVETFSKTDVVNMFKNKTMWKVEEND